MGAVTSSLKGNKGQMDPTRPSVSSSAVRSARRTEGTNGTTTKPPQRYGVGSTYSASSKVTTSTASTSRRGPIPKYCLYLYVSDANVLCPALEDAKNSAWVQNWGGLHCTLCSFSALASAPSRFKHGGNLQECVGDMHIAASTSARKNGLKEWRLRPEVVNGWGLDASEKLIVGLSCAKDPILAAMATEHAKYNLARGDEKMKGLHLTLGPLTAFEKNLKSLIGSSEIKKVKKGSCPVPSAMVEELCQLQWDLLIVKDANGISPHTVTDKEDRVSLRF